MSPHRSAHAPLCLPVVSLPLVLLLATALRGGEFDPVLYSLEAGSFLVDDCLDCDRPVIEVPVSGRFLLRRLPVRIVGELYALEGLQLFGDLGGSALAVTGSGSYYRRSPEEDNFSLELEVNGISGAHLESGPFAPTAKWPALDAAAAEDGSRDPFHLYRVRLVASPRASSVPYELVPGELQGFTGSIFLDDCTICGRPTIPVPVKGTFLLVPLEVGGPNPFETYAVEALDLSSVVPEVIQYHIVGSGTYRQGGEVALTQSMELEITVDEALKALLRADPAPFPEGVAFPDISLHLAHVDPESPLHVYSLQLEARPVKEPLPQAFRRGDANADATFDISDAVFTLSWLFSGSREPPCLDAANSNGDDLVNLSDAVYSLGHLFQGGPAPPTPGPDDCASGFIQLGCASFPPCP